MVIRLCSVAERTCRRALLSAAVLAIIGCGPQGAPQSLDTPRAINSADGAPAAMTNSIGMNLVRIPAGEFWMGSADTDPGRRDDEQPRHRVRITSAFYMGAYEVTQGEHEAVMGANPSAFSKAAMLKNADASLDCSRFPVDCVTWHDAVEFCRRLSDSSAEKQAGRAYRLPTEAEWEYACRAGATTVFCFGDVLSSSQANFNGNYPFGEAAKGPFLNRTTTVGSYQPNAFGLYDMHGNLHEWCADRFDRDYYKYSPSSDPQGPDRGSSRVIRGGDWYSDGRDCRSAFRYADIPDGVFYALGFRVVCQHAAPGQDRTADATEPTGRQPTSSAPTNGKIRPDPSRGEDWPHWRGPRSDGTWKAPKLARNWPQNGLEQIWRNDLGAGYGGISVSEKRVYVMDRQQQPEDVERVNCFDAVDGSPVWTRSYPVNYGKISYGNGPRGTPTVLAGRVYTLGAAGQLLCLDTSSGEIVWSKVLVAEFAARVPLWGLSASPVAFEDLVIVHVGAEPDGCYLAFQRDSGQLRWRSLSDPAGYATPIIVPGTPPLLVGWTPTNVRGLDPHTGKLLWTIPFEVNNGTAIADPIAHDGLVLVSSYYDGSKAIRLGPGPQAAAVAWEDRRNLRALMSQPLYRDGFAYLLDKRHGLTCFELSAGKKLWDDDNRLTPKGRNPQATLVWLNDGDLALALNSDGELILADLNPAGYQELARAGIIGPTWAHPAYAGNCVYARSDSEIVCVVLPQAAE